PSDGRGRPNRRPVDRGARGVALRLQDGGIAGLQEGKVEGIPPSLEGLPPSLSPILQSCDPAIVGNDTRMKIALLQINPTVGDLAGNARLIADAVRQAGCDGADLAVTPELALVGYLPRDLLLNEGFVRRSWEVLADVARELKD